MNSKIVKILSGLTIVSFLVIGSLAFYVSKKLEPESLKKELSKVVESNHPLLKLNLSSLSVNLGLTTEIEILGINLTTRAEQPSSLLSLNKGTVKIPILNILTGGGTIKLDLLEPLINYSESEAGSNWLQALKNEKDTKKVKKNTTALPAFLAGSQINAEFHKLTVNHTNKSLEKNELHFQSIQLKDIGIKRPMAFKLSSDIALKAAKFKLEAIGEFNLRSFIEDKVIRAKVLAKIKAISVLDKKIPIEELTSDIKLLFRKDKSGKIDFDIKSEDLLKSKISVFVLKDEIKADIQNVQIKLEQLLKAANVKMDGISYNDSWLEAKGIITSSPMEKITPDFDVAISKPITYKAMGQKINIERIKASLKDKELLLETTMKILKGRVDFTAANELNINKPIDFSKLKTTKASLILNGLEIPKALLESGGENKENKEKKKEEKTKIALLPLKLSIEMKNILVVNEVINGSGELIAAKDSVAVKNLSIKHGEGKIIFDSTTKNLTKVPKHSFNVEAKNINAQLFDVFLSKDSPRLTGVVNASAVGKVGSSYDVFVKGNAKRGELKGIDISKLVNDQVNKINEFPYFKKKPIKNVRIPQDYERINFDLNAKSSKISLKKIVFIGVGKKIELKSQGVIRPTRSSEVFVNLFDKKGNYLKFLRKNFKTTSLPLRMSGPGYDLKPDYGYTSKVLLGKLKNVAKKKLEKKAKSKVKKELKKILKGKKAKDLIKGLFQ